MLNLTSIFEQTVDSFANMFNRNWILSLQWYITCYSLVGFIGFLFFMMVLGLYYYRFSSFTHFSRQDIPHKKRLPYMGTMGLWQMLRKSYPEYMLQMYKELKDLQYGVMHTFQRPMIVLIDPELIEAVTKRDFHYFLDRRSVFIENQGSDWKMGLPHLRGLRWKEARRVLHEALTPKKVKEMFEKMSVCCHQLLNYLEECDQRPSQEGWIKKDGDNLILETKNVFTRYAIDVVASTTFGTQVDSLKEPKNKFFTMATSATSFEGLSGIRWSLYMTGPKTMTDLKISPIPEKVNQFFKAKITNILSTLGTENSTSGIAQQFIEAQETWDSEHGTPKMTQESILAQSLIILLSGFDTTSTLLCFTAYLLATNPEIQTRLQKEVDSALKNQELTYDAVKGMKYLDMVLSETLRLHPPAVSTDRICVKRYGLDAEPGIELKPGDHVLIPIYGLHRDPKHFPQPERFDPERFSDQNRHKIKPYTYMPFGQGPRCCLGTDFAKMQVKLLLVHLLANFNFKVISKTPVPLKLVHTGFNLTADKGFWLGLEKRTS